LLRRVRELGTVASQLQPPFQQIVRAPSNHHSASARQLNIDPCSSFTGSA
jgi:hypothetical protein